MRNLSWDGIGADRRGSPQSAVSTDTIPMKAIRRRRSRYLPVSACC